MLAYNVDAQLRLTAAIISLRGAISAWEVGASTDLFNGSLADSWNRSTKQSSVRLDYIVYRSAINNEL